VGSASSSVKVQVRYFALLREERGSGSENIDTSAANAAALYGELKSRYKFSLTIDHLKVAVNNNFVDWQTSLKDGDEIVFVPPVAGG
jgi:molybdopterin converting factor subunit 1